MTGTRASGCRKSQATGGAAGGAGRDGIVRRQGVRRIDAEHLAVLVDVEPRAALRSIIMLARIVTIIMLARIVTIIMLALIVTIIMLARIVTILVLLRPLGCTVTDVVSTIAF